MARSDYLAEVAYAYDPATEIARTLGYGIGRDYRRHGQRPNELAGTADMVRLRSGSIEVYDWKTGRSDAAHYRWQLRLLGLAAAREARMSECIIRVVRVGEVEVDDSWFEALDAEDLDDIAAEVRRIWNEIPNAQPKAGPHCDENYCRARQRCGGYRTWRAA